MSTDDETGKIPWLIMLYLAGDNGLAEEMVLAMQDLQAEGPPEGDKIVAQFDPSGVGLSTQRYDFSALVKGKPLDYYRDRTYTGAETNTGSPLTLADFVRWAIQGTDADTKYLLILSGHGSGTTEEFLMRDDASADALTISELREALKLSTEAIREQTGNQKTEIDVLGFSACYMAMGEIAYELRDYAGILVGSEGPEPVFGWPYRRILARAKQNRYITGRPLEPRELAAIVVDEYVDFYSDYDRTAGRSVDLAAIDLARIASVRDEMKALVTELNDANQDSIVLAHWYAQTYKFDQFVDLRDLCDQLQKQFGRHAVSKASAEVQRAVDRAVITSGCSGFSHQFSYGLSIYFPWAFVWPDYGHLKFATDTGWHGFLNTHVVKTRRAPRDGYEQQTVLPALHGDFEAAVAKRRSRLRSWLHAAKLGLQDPAPEDLDELARAIVQRMRRAIKSEAALGNVEARLEKIVDAIASADIPAEDVPREIARRLLHGSGFSPAKSRYSDDTCYSGDTRPSGGTRYSDDTCYSDDTRCPNSREKAVKNLPAVSGQVRHPRSTN